MMGKQDLQLLEHTMGGAVKNEPTARPHEKVVCFIPCCGTKTADGSIIEPQASITGGDLPYTWMRLMRGRELMQYCVDSKSQKTAAINLYAGIFYDAISAYKRELIEWIRTGRLRLVIISAGYGVVDALEPIHSYDAVMNGKTARQWRDVGLAEVIADLLLKEEPERVYGFFAGAREWSKGGSKYRYFFMEGAKIALQNGLSPRSCGCFYRMEERGVRAILGALGRAFAGLLRCGFDEAYMEEVCRSGGADGSVRVGFDDLLSFSTR